MEKLGKEHMVNGGKGKVVLSTSLKHAMNLQLKQFCDKLTTITL